MRRLIHALAASAISSSALVAACNLDGDYFGTGGFGGVGGFSSSGTSGTSGAFTVDAGQCSAAAEGEPCSSLAMYEECEAHEHPNIACNAELTCEPYQWTRAASPRRADCATECPSAFTKDLPNGCSIPNANTLICEYPEGTCGCAPLTPPVCPPDEGDPDPEDAGDAGDAGIPRDLDGGATDAGPWVWRCLEPEAGCPRTRPKGGTNCVRPITCDYGEGIFEDGVRMRCTDHRWTKVRCGGSK
jgi:hypothetical protein